MKTPVWSLTLGAGVLLLCGCSTAGLRYDDSNKSLLESGKVYVHAANNSLPDNPSQAKKYTEYAEDVLGIPEEEETPAQIEKRHQADRKIEAERDKAESKLIELGKQKEQENNRNIISRLWHWGLATFGLAGVIAVCVLFPPLIPFILQIVVHFATWWFIHFPVILGTIYRTLYSATSDIYNVIKNSKSQKPPSP